MLDSKRFKEVFKKQWNYSTGSNQNRSVPDIELHYRRGNSDDRVCVISGPSCCMDSPQLCKRRVSSHQFGAHQPGSHHMHHLRHQTPTHHRSGSMMSGASGSTSSRPRICEHQPFSFSLSRATSRESVRSFVHQPGSYESNGSHYEKVLFININRLYRVVSITNRSQWLTVDYALYKCWYG